MNRPLSSASQVGRGIPVPIKTMATRFNPGSASMEVFHHPCPTGFAGAGSNSGLELAETEAQNSGHGYA